jgi:aldose 1-epimerase
VETLPVPPSGRQHLIRHGAQTAVVVEGGGGLRTYRLDDVDVLDGYAPTEMCTGGRGQVLLPWPNRIRGGRYTWDGREHQLPIDETDVGNAIHGLARWRSWRLRDSAEDRVVLGVRLLPRPGYPFLLDVTAAYALDRAGLAVTTTVANIGAAAAPYGYGAHPYLTVGTPSVDAAVLRVPAATYLPTDEARVPSGRAAVAGTAYDFRTGRRIGDAVLDVAFTDLARDADGHAEVTVSAPESARSVTLWMDGHHRYVQVFTGDTLAADRRRRGLAVEPMTCPGNAFATGVDVLRLEPGATVTSRWGIRPG